VLPEVGSRRDAEAGRPALRKTGGARIDVSTNGSALSNTECWYS
jgi:hypothetical protein